MGLLVITALSAESNLLLEKLLPWEQRILAGGALWNRLSAQLFLLRTGVGGRKVKQALENMPATGVERILLTGFAGGVNRGLKPGDLILATRYGYSDNPILQPPAWEAGELLSLGFQDKVVEQGLLWTVDRPLRSDRERETLQKRKVAAVDMEAYPVAEYCKQRRLQLVTLRIITDGGDDQALQTFRRNYRRLGRELQEDLIPYLRRWL